MSHIETKIYSILDSGAFCLRQNAQRAALRAAGQATSGKAQPRASYSFDCQTSKTRMCARLEIRTGRLAHVASRRARAVRAKCSLAGLTTRLTSLNYSDQSLSHAHARGHRVAYSIFCKLITYWPGPRAQCSRANFRRRKIQNARRRRIARQSIFCCIVAWEPQALLLI